MSYKNEKRVIEDCCITKSSPEHKFYASYPHTLPNDLTVTFSNRGTFEVVITDTFYEVRKID